MDITWFVGVGGTLVAIVIACLADWLSPSPARAELVVEKNEPNEHRGS